MKKLIVLGLVLACSLSAVATAHGHEGRDFDRDRRDHRPPVREHRDSRERMRARDVLRETNNVLERAQRSSDRGGYRNGLGRAFAHQEEARDLYRYGRYERSISHSLRAREIAEDIIRANRDRRYRRHRAHHDYNRHDDLDNSLSVKIIDDNVALKFRINLD
ncbi:MAG TPA: hypothetical protein VEC37_11680 [Bacillota bacterium]|nr:hypothetical protein [Bacillota bacterium]